MTGIIVPFPTSKAREDRKVPPKEVESALAARLEQEVGDGTRDPSDPRYKRPEMRDLGQIAENLYGMLERVERRKQEGDKHKLTKAELLVGAGIGAEGHSTKHLYRYALKPGLEREQRGEKLKVLTRRLRPYVRIALYAYEQGGLSRSEAYLDLFRGTGLIDPAPADRRPVPSYIDWMCGALNDMAEWVIREAGVTVLFDELRQVPVGFSDYAEHTDAVTDLHPTIDVVTQFDASSNTDILPLPKFNLYSRPIGEPIAGHLTVYEHPVPRTGEAEDAAFRAMEDLNPRPVRESGRALAQLYRNVWLCIAPIGSQRKPAAGFLLRSEWRIWLGQTQLNLAVPYIDFFGGEWFDKTSIEGQEWFDKTSIEPNIGYEKTCIIHDDEPNVMRPAHFTFDRMKNKFPRTPYPYRSPFEVKHHSHGEPWDGKFDCIESHYARVVPVTPKWIRILLDLPANPSVATRDRPWTQTLFPSVLAFSRGDLVYWPHDRIGALIERELTSLDTEWRADTVARADTLRAAIAIRRKQAVERLAERRKIWRSGPSDESKDAGSSYEQL
ncbi:MAG: hypothetical protein AB7S71_14615 [Dongiaceae bacterium]